MSRTPGNASFLLSQFSLLCSKNVSVLLLLFCEYTFGIRSFELMVRCCCWSANKLLLTISVDVFVLVCVNKKCRVEEEREICAYRRIKLEAGETVWFLFGMEDKRTDPFNSSLFVFLFIYLDPG